MAISGDSEKTLFITGGAGFIGANLLEYFSHKYPRYLLINIDCLKYSANKLSLEKVSKSPNYRFYQINICDGRALRELFGKYLPDGVIHLAAETHVDRSISSPYEFMDTNIEGTFNLLEACRDLLDSGHPIRFHHISTDEVFGSDISGAMFTESHKYYPNSPYAATKAASDHLVRAWYKTYGLDTVTTNCGNNFGPYQYPEKLIPLAIVNFVQKKPVPIYGDGSHVRDWIYVNDHCRGIDIVFHGGRSGETYNIGARNEFNNLALIEKIADIIDNHSETGSNRELIKFVEDRPGHDRRYAIDPSKIEKELGWHPEYSFDKALSETVKWYNDNQRWLESALDEEYRKYYKGQYSEG